jgi:hypothetical protein
MLDAAKKQMGALSSPEWSGAQRHLFSQGNETEG